MSEFTNKEKKKTSPDNLFLLKYFTLQNSGTRPIFHTCGVDSSPQLQSNLSFSSLHNQPLILHFIDSGLQLTIVVMV